LTDQLLVRTAHPEEGMKKTMTLTEKQRLGAPISALERVRYLRGEMGLTETEISDATGASTRTVRRWASAHEDDLQREPNYAQQIDDLHAVVVELKDSLTARGIRQWLRSRNRYLKGERPIDLLRNGKFEDVYEAAIAFRDGVYV
jgi:uncharacterized protein (DUF2384 family)